MRRIFLSTLSLFLCVGTLIAQHTTYPQDFFAPPMDIPLVLSGTFGELRTNHFHSGIDIKTQGKEGQPILAAAAGVVYRIKVSPYGYGNAIYIRHQNGYSTVYGHLQRFKDDIQTYVRAEQYRQQKFEVELYPPTGRFVVEKGEMIALSGNSGGSGGPHLHFEVRDSKTEEVINPLFFGFDVKDSKNPVLHNFNLYEFDDANELYASQDFTMVNTAPGEYRLTGNGLVECRGFPAFSIGAYDRLDGANNKNGVYQIKLKVGDVTYYNFEMERFAFHETRYINSHIDFGLKTCCNKRVNRLYIEPNNRLSIYDVKEKMYLPNLVKDSVYKAEIEVFDFEGNKSVLSFDLKKTEELPHIEDASDLVMFKYNQANSFSNDFVEINLPKDALYRDVYFEYEETAPCVACASPVYLMGASEIPIQKYFKLKLKIPPTYKGDKSKLAVASIKNNRVVDYEGATLEGNFVVGRTRQLGYFALVADSTAPVVKPLNFSQGKNVSATRILKIKVSDAFSGIEKYEAQIDGQWVLMEYDAKYNLMTIDLSKLTLSSGKHELKLEFSDALQNKSEHVYNLLW